jgi:hypothetical protein
MTASQTFFGCIPEARDHLLALVPTVPLNRGSGFACGVENIHAEIVDRTTIAAHEASASKTARRERVGT